MSVFVHAQGKKTVHTRRGGQKMAKFCPRIILIIYIKDIVGKPCNIYRLRGNPIIIMGFTRNL
jgi:hypothetical protein